MTDQGGMIRINNLTKTYKGNSKPALDGLSLSIASNEIYGLLGPNGAGKTTFVSLLCGVLQPTKGTISIMNSVGGINNSIKQLIGVVPQDIALYPNLTATENLYFFGRLFGLRGDDLRNRVSYHLEKSGLVEHKKKKVKKYSGGMKRRLNLIAGIIHEPRILFLDEPTVGIDVQSKKVIIDTLRELQRKGTTMIYTSHQMEEAEKLCDRIGIIDEGKLVVSGTPAELIAGNNGCASLEDVYLNLTGKNLRDQI